MRRMLGSLVCLPHILVTNRIYLSNTDAYEFRHRKGADGHFMSHSEEGENYWPGYVDALTSMVQVLAFVMMMLAMAVFVLSQSVSKHAVEAIAKAVNADVKPNSDMKQLTQAVMDKIQSLGSVGPASQNNSAPPPAENAAAKPTVQIDGASEPSLQKPVAMRISSARARNDQASVQPPPDAPRLTLGFEERGFRIDQDRAQSLTKFAEDNKIAERAGAVVVNAYAYSGDGALSEARRLAYYRAMMARKQLVDTKTQAENIRINVTDTTDKDRGSTVEIIIAGGSSTH
jgi:hypothetical protein